MSVPSAPHGGYKSGVLTSHGPSSCPTGSPLTHRTAAGDVLHLEPGQVQCALTPVAGLQALLNSIVDLLQDEDAQG